MTMTDEKDASPASGNELVAQLQAILAEADAAGKIDWNVSVDATICRAHQHGTNTTRPERDTGGTIESQEPPLPGL